MAKDKETGVEPGRITESVQYIKLEDFRPNPYQPASRVEITEEVAKEFGLSILEHGLLQTPVARFILGEGAISQDQVSNGHYEIGDGWLRLAGFRYLLAKGNNGYAEMPVSVREFTDQQMADLVMEANTVRKDLNPLELAAFYKRYLEDFKITQAEMARRHNCSQGEIANTIRLLELPADIQGEIISQEISATGGLQLLRLNAQPDLQAKIAKVAIERRFSVTEIDRSVSQVIWRESKSLNPQAQSYEGPPAFDLAGCKECPNKTKAADPWGNHKKEDRCLDSKCWEKKQEAAKKELLDKAWQEIKDKGDAAKIITSDQLSYNEWEDLSGYKKVLDNPAECDQCTKTALFKYHITDKDEPRKICTDPACYRKKKTKRTKNDNVTLKLEDKALTAKLGEAFGHVQERPRECLLLLARKEVNALSAAGRVDLLIMFKGLPTVTNGRMDPEATKASLDAKTFEELLQLAMAAYITNRRRNSWEQYSTKLEEKVAADLALITGSGGKKPAEKKAKVKKEPAEKSAAPATPPAAEEPPADKSAPDLATLEIKTPADPSAFYHLSIGGQAVMSKTLKLGVVKLFTALGVIPAGKQGVEFDLTKILKDYPESVTRGFLLAILEGNQPAEVSPKE